MDAGSATTIAAGIAAVASIVTLVLTLRAGARSEMRAAHREAIRDHLEDLSENIHTVVAGVVVMRKRAAAGSDVGNWQEKAKSAGTAIGSVRRRTSYLLPHLGSSLRHLELASDHVATYGALPGTNVNELVSEYQALSDLLNSELARTYRSGEPTPRWRAYRLDAACKRVDRLWEQRPKRGQ